MAQNFGPLSLPIAPVLINVYSLRTFKEIFHENLASHPLISSLRLCAIGSHCARAIMSYVEGGKIVPDDGKDR